MPHAIAEARYHTVTAEVHPSPNRSAKGTSARVGQRAERDREREREREREGGRGGGRGRERGGRKREREARPTYYSTK